MQWGYRGGNKFCIGCALLFLLVVPIEKFEILEVWKEPNEVQDLPTRTFRLLESEETKCWCEVSEASLDVLDGAE